VEQKIVSHGDTETYSVGLLWTRE